MNNSISSRLSFQAKTHRRAAITVIALAKIALGILGFNAGLWVALEGCSLPVETKWLLGAVALGAIWFYPTRHLKKRQGKPAYYRRQKTMDGVLAGLGFAFWFFVGNLSPAWVAVPATGSPAAGNNVTVAWSSLEKPLPDCRREIVASGKWKRWLSEKARARITGKIAWYQRMSRNIDDGGKAALTFLVILVALLLIYLLAALSCSIACSGMEGLAVVVAVVGAIAITFGVVAAIRGIWFSKEERESDQRRRNKRAPTKTDGSQ